MGNTTSTKIAAVSALESIQKDTLQRWPAVETELINVKKELLDREYLPLEKVEELVKKKKELRRHCKTMRYNLSMVENALQEIHRRQSEALCSEAEQFNDFLSNFALESSSEVTDEEVDAFMASLK